VRYPTLYLTDSPQVTNVPHSVYTVNETNNASMVCHADSEPQATITWRKTGNSEILEHGEQFQIFHASKQDDGRYICIARNYLGSDSREVTLNVQSKCNLRGRYLSAVHACAVPRRQFLKRVASVVGYAKFQNSHTVQDHIFQP